MYKFLIIVFLLVGCRSLSVPPDFRYKEIKTRYFTIATWQKITNPISSYKIYIEGDGYAFDAYGNATENPTPKGYLVRKMAFSDNSPNVIYLARPCQYVKCAIEYQKYWTTARFGFDVIEAEYNVIKNIVYNNKLILVGFSGGAQVAGLIATTKKDLNIKKIITIAGNLDHKLWTLYHKLPFLYESINLSDFKGEFMKIPQTHYVGNNDRIIPPELTKMFVKDENIIVLVPGATHSEGWDDIFNKVHSEN